MIVLLMLTSVLLLIRLLLICLLLLVLPLIMLLLSLIMISSVTGCIPTMLLLKLFRHMGRPAGEVDIYATSVRLGRELKAQITAHLFDARLDFLNVVR